MPTEPLTMQPLRCALTAIVAFAVLTPAHADEALVNPLSQVISLLGNLKAKIQAEGDKELQQYKEYMEWCDDNQADTGNLITEETNAEEEEEATISEATSLIGTASANIEKVGSDLSETEAELQKATQIRKKERADFVASEKDLTDVLETIEKAMRVLKKEAANNPASLAQISNAGAGNLVKVLGLMADAASITGAEQQRLTSLAQAHSQSLLDSEDESTAFAAPAASVYESKSGSVIDLLEDLKEKATAELSDLRQAEATAKHNFEMLEQSLTDENGALTQQLKGEKARKAEASEDKATTEGEHAETLKLLASNKASLEETLAACKRTTADHEDTVKGREEELKAVDEATEIIKEMSGGAAEKTYSFMQLSAASQLRSHDDLAHLEALALVQRLAKAHPSAALSQVATQLAGALQSGTTSGKDAFAKVKSLIRNLIEQLQAEAGEEADTKAYCDEEMGKTKTKKDDLTENLDKVTSKIEKAVSRVAKLKEDIAELQSQLAKTASSQAEIDKLRKESHDDYVEAKDDLEKGIQGVRKALGVLREYYASKDKEAAAAAMLQEGLGVSSFGEAPPKPETYKKSSGAGAGIISVLELCEADFTKNLEKVEAKESESLEDYKKITEENKVSTAEKNTAVKEKTKEFKGLEVAITEDSSDRDSLDSELGAILEYETKLKKKCIGKAETYEERKARRDEQIEGLREAVKMLSVTSFAQRGKGSFLRTSLSPGQF